MQHVEFVAGLRAVGGDQPVYTQPNTSDAQPYQTNYPPTNSVIPVPGTKAGELVDFGGLFGSTPVMAVRNSGASDAFVHFGGRIPAPIQLLRNY